jgi:hypothetical protein
LQLQPVCWSCSNMCQTHQDHPGVSTDGPGQTFETNLADPRT